MSERLGLPSVNLGVSSYSPLIYELQVKNVVSQFNADVVVMQIYSNDFGGDESYLKDAVSENNAIIGIDGGKNSAIVSTARLSYLARFLRKSQLLLMTIIANSKDTFEMPSSAFDYEQGVTDEQLLNTVNIIQRIQSYLAKRDKKLYVFLIPSKSLSLAGECCSNDHLYARFYSALIKLRLIR